MTDPATAKAKLKAAKRQRREAEDLWRKLEDEHREALSHLHREVSISDAGARARAGFPPAGQFVQACLAALAELPDDPCALNESRQILGLLQAYVTQGLQPLANRKLGLKAVISAHATVFAAMGPGPLFFVALFLESTEGELRARALRADPTITVRLGRA